MSKILTSNPVEKEETLHPLFNPFPGLRPFSVDESHLFFGREGQSDEILKKLADNRFVAVIGASGSGKSSLMFCGLVPILHGGFIAKAGSNWRVVITRPGVGPIDNLAAALVKSDSDETVSDEDKEVRKSITSAVLRSSSLGLIDSVRQLNQTANENVLLMVDQFEELFRFKKSAEDNSSINESEAFIKLLLEAVEQSEVPIYVVLTMRSDFIGECAQFQNLTKLINDSQYLIPQMSREDLRDAVVGPVAVGGGAISPHLVQHLLNDVGDNPDQLPILQHALMRSWNHWTDNREGNEPMDVYNYEAIGKMEKALSEHANEAYDELSENGKVICGKMFKVLTEKVGDNRGIRHPTRLGDMPKLIHAEQSEIIEVIDIFRAPGRSFVTPAAEFRLNDNSIVDISHESLMRVWDRLKLWVEEESVAVATYMRISEASAMYQIGKTSLWRPPDLQLALNWKEKQNPTLAWATRYDNAFERAMVFLETSRLAYETEEQNKIRLQKRALQRSRIVAIVLGAFAIVSLGFMLYAIVQQVEAENSKKLAETQRKEAELQKDAAEKAKDLAKQAEKLANLQKLEAEKQKENALIQQKLAQQSAEEALKQKAIAEKKTQEAIQLNKIAVEQTAMAKKSAQEALAQKSKAEEASIKADNLRMQSIAQSMAVKSAAMTKDTARKALLAFQAYQYNSKYGGKVNNPDVYDGLYFALKYLNVDAYNSLKGHTNAVRGMAFAKNNEVMYSTGSDGKLLKWNINNANAQPVLMSQSTLINRALAISKDNHWLACVGEDKYISIFDLKNETAAPKHLFGHTDMVWAVAFEPDNNSLVTASADSTIRHWEINNSSNKIIAKLKVRIKAVAVSPNGHLIAGACEDGSVYLWNKLKNYESTLLFKEPNNSVFAIAFSNDGNMLVTGDRIGNLKIFDTKTRELLNTLAGHNARINDLKFSPDDKLLATASYDGSVQLWKVDNLNDSPITMKDNTSWVWSIAFTPDGEKLIAGCVDNLIRIYPTKTNVMADQMCDKLHRNMTKKEWNNFVGKEIQYEKTCPKLPEGIDDTKKNK